MAEKKITDVLLLTAVFDEFEQIRLHVHPDAGTSSWEEIDDADGKPLLRGAFLTSKQEALRFTVGYCSKMGALDALGRALRLSDEYDFQCLAMCGVCAGNPEKTRQGDVVVAKEVWRYGPGKETVQYSEDGRSENRQEDVEVEPMRPEAWIQQAETYCDVFATQSREKLEKRYPREMTEPYDFSVRVGSVQTVPDVTIDEKAFAEVRSLKRGTIALEMEGIGIAKAAQLLQVDNWIMAKGVQDFARPVLGGTDKNDDFREFAAYSSALFVIEFLRCRLAPRRDRSDVNQRLLREGIIKSFSLEELDLLCADIEQDLKEDNMNLQVNLEIVGGSGKGAKVLRLIEFLARRHLLSYLLKAIYRARPDFRLEA